MLLFCFTCSPGAFLVSRWWVNQTSSAIHISRKFERHAFPGEKIPVELIIENKSRLPLIWLHAQESLAIEIANTKILRQVFTLAPRSKDLLIVPVAAAKAWVLSGWAGPAVHRRFVRPGSGKSDHG